MRAKQLLFTVVFNVLHHDPTLVLFLREEAGLAAGERLWKRGKVTTEDLVGGRVMTSGKTSGSFTSSSLTVIERRSGAQQ